MATKTKTTKRTTTAPQKIINREHWLTECAKKLAPMIEKLAGREMPKYKISVGFPSKNALSRKRRVVGQCFSGLMSKGGVHELFISPLLADTVEVAATVAHELIHPFEMNHRKKFGVLARGIGLIGPNTATVAGPEFKKVIAPILDRLGEYPHHKLEPNSKFRSQTTRLWKAECDKCGYTVRISRKWLKVGVPSCPTDKIKMSHDEIPEDED